MMLIPMQQARHPLAALMDRVRDRNGWSDSQVVSRAVRAGETLSKSNISRVRNTDVVSLTGSTIKGLAAGLGIPAAEVAKAALESMGITLADAGSLDLETVIKTDSTLSSDNREMLLGLVSQMRHLEAKRATDDEEQEPRTQEGSSKHGGAGSEALQSGAPIVAANTAADEGEPLIYSAIVARHDEAGDLIEQDQGSQADHALAAREGETEDEIRERLGIPYD